MKLIRREPDEMIMKMVAVGRRARGQTRHRTWLHSERVSMRSSACTSRTNWEGSCERDDEGCVSRHWLDGGTDGAALLGAGFPVRCGTVTPPRPSRWPADGAEIAASPADAVAGAAVVFTMLTNGQAVSEVLFERGRRRWPGRRHDRRGLQLHSPADRPANMRADWRTRAFVTSTHRFQAAW